MSLKIAVKGRWKLTRENGMTIVVDTTAIEAPDTHAGVPSGAAHEIVLDRNTGTSESADGTKIEALSDDEQELVLLKSTETSGHYSSSSSEMCSGVSIPSKTDSKESKKESKKKTKKQSKREQ